MEKQYYFFLSGKRNISIVSVPLKTLNTDELVKSYYQLDDGVSLTKDIFNMFSEFCEFGFTQDRVKNAYRTSVDDCMILFSDDCNFKSNDNILAISFNHKFYALNNHKYGVDEKELIKYWNSRIEE